MPWCEECARYLTPNSMTDDGRCPKCGDDIAGSHVHEGDEAGDDERTPWHFKLLVVGVVVYLVWRIADLIT